ncbi:hypothetical protein A3F66_00040 [candidate division TM6 bacterium RIFCSPHIGHO2_12_FULL_32_22]|nr:MAG: hypothetical protein A3F66_00040 [candidate division TM6 bacterium RIFCSPHIGHO2_12_FULL_32_22]
MTSTRHKSTLTLLLFSSYLFSGELDSQVALSGFSALDYFESQMGEAKLHGIREFVLNPEAFKELFKAFCNNEPLDELQSNLMRYFGISNNFHLQNAFFEGMLLSVKPYERYVILAHAGPNAGERFGYTLIDSIGRLAP